MYITNRPEIALIAERYGVDRVWIDLETLGKEERQKGMNTVKSHHTIEDIAKMSKILTKSALQVRINPWNTNSVIEITKVLAAGAQIIMLPMWKSPAEVESFIRTVNGQAKTLLLLETKEAVDCLDEVLHIPGIDEIHIGLNDLHLSYGLTFMFELLANGNVERIGNKIKAKGLPFGFGGLSKIGDGILPSEKIMVEHYRLGSSMAILSRGFCNPDVIVNMKEFDYSFEKRMKQFRFYEGKASQLDAHAKLLNNSSVIKAVNQAVLELKNR